MDVDKIDQKLIRVIRDAILFLAGLAGIAYETLVEGGDKPTLLVLFGAMVGLPAFLRTDEKKGVEKTAPTGGETNATPNPNPKL